MLKLRLIGGFMLLLIVASNLFLLVGGSAPSTENISEEGMEGIRSSLSNKTREVSPVNTVDFNATTYENKWSNFLFLDNNLTRITVGIEGNSENYQELESLVRQYGAQIVSTVKIEGQVIAAVVEIQIRFVSAFMQNVRNLGFTRYVEPCMEFKASFIPNDPYWGSQWAPEKIEAQIAWDTTVGDSSILVAVVDTGIYYAHEDLADNYVALGYDWVNDDPYPLDDNGHGTHCAGIIAAVINNNVGIAGLAQVSIMAEKGLNSWGYGYSDWLANAIIHAVDQGADIISMSWGGYGYSQLIYEAIQYAYDAGVLLVAAAGNDGTNLKLYPAAYEEVIAVTATDINDQKAWWSNFGEWVELAAPGVDIYSTVPWGYEYLSGTSMAAPHVAGVAALALSRFPNSSREWLRLWLRYATDDLGASGFDVYYGYGRINARKSVEETPIAHDLILMDWKTPPYVEPNTTATIDVTVLNFGGEDENDVTVQLMANGSIVGSNLIDFLASKNTASISFSWTPTVQGWYNITAYIIPVANEENVENNVLSTNIYVGHPVKAFVLRSAGNIIPDIVTNWQVLNSEWQKFGDTLIYIDYTTLDKEAITYQDINATGADVLIISCACDPFLWQFTDAEIEAIKKYVYEGHGLIATSGTFYFIVPNNNKLAPLFGLNETISWDVSSTDLLHLLDATHPLFNAVPNPLVFPSVATAIPSDGIWDSGELSGGKYSAIGHFEESAIVTYRGLVYLSPLLEIIPAYYHHHLQLLYNAILWSRYRKPDHDLKVSLESLTYPDPGETFLINATVQNLGAKNETNVDLFILIDGEKVASLENFPLNVGESRTISYLWTPEEGTYNITAFSPPVPGEDEIFNNWETIYCAVSYIPVIGFVESHGETLHSEELKIYYKSLGYFVETIRETLTIKLLKNYDILVVGEDWYNVPWGTSEIAAVKNFIAQGNGLIAIGDEPSSSLQEVLSEYGITYTGYIAAPGPSSYFNSSHPIMLGVNYIFVPNPINSLRIMHPAYWIANDATNEHTIIAGAETGGKVLSLSDDFAAFLHEYDNKKMFKNIVQWMTPYEHDLAAFLHCAEFAEPGDTVSLNITVYNLGKSNESNVELRIFVNSTQIENITIPQLLTGSWNVSTYQWSPSEEGVYNVTAYVLPVPNEKYVVNNQDAQFVKVETLPDILIVSDDDAHSCIFGTSLGEFESILTAGGYEYFVWRESVLGNPPLEFLTKFKVVIWTCGDYWAGAVDPKDALTLEQYLANGGCILLEGEDIGHDHRYDNFMYNVAHAFYSVDDTGAPGLTVTDPTHPVTSGLPPSFYWLYDPPYDDGVDPVNYGKEVIRYSGTSWTAVTVFDGGGTGCGSVVYYAFPIYGLDFSERKTLVTNSVEWLLAAAIKHDVAILNVTANPTQIYMGQEVNINVTVTNEGEATENFTVKVYCGNETGENVTEQIPPPNAMWISPPTIDLTGCQVGTRFNITVYVNLDVASFTWQFMITYNKFLLKAVRCGYTGEDNRSEFFQGLPTYSVQPVFEDFNETHAYVLHGESLLGLVERAPGWGSLSWIEFEVTNVPTGFHEGTIKFETDGTYVLDPSLRDIQITHYSSAYYFSPFPSLIGQEQVQLAPGENATLTFTWDTAGLPLGNYTIKAVIPPLEREIDIEDNVFVDGTVEILWRHDVAVIDVSSTLTWIFEGQAVSFNVTVLNKGDFTENVTITLYCNISSSQSIGTATIKNLLPMETETVILVWNTTGVTPGSNYTITAVATIEEPDITPQDNMLVYGEIEIRILGDLNGDGKVNMKDISLVSHAFGSYPGAPNWNPLADFDGNNYINMRDIVVVARNFGRTS